MVDSKNRMAEATIENQQAPTEEALKNGNIDDTYYLEQASIAEDSVDGFQYDEIQDFDDLDISVVGDEDYHTASKQAQESQEPEISPHNVNNEIEPTLRTRPEVIEDFVRNFLVRMEMSRTLDCFQTEWYEMKEKGILKEQGGQSVPDCYARNKQLDLLVNDLKEELTSYKDAAQKAKDMHLKLRKERDFHRMHHKRVVQEKDRLVADIKRMKQHYASYEPTLKTLQTKYENAMKEKMLTKLERDRAVGQIEGLQSAGQYFNREIDIQKKVALQEKLDQQRNYQHLQQAVPHHLAPSKHPQDSDFPPDKGVNPLLSKDYKPCPHLTRSSGLRITNTIKSHSLAVCGFAIHPRKEILASVSDDQTWKLISIPEGEVIMTGEGHQDWVSDCDFSPSGNQLATASGDTSVKIWDFAKESCVETFNDHTHAVWGCSWHSCGDFLATCSMDGTSKIWDLNSSRCRNTLRGHADSVNSIKFLHYSNILVTCSADKTISLWDARTGLCAQTFYDHVHSINDVTFNLGGDKLASCDAYGIVKLWDVRNACAMTSIDAGPHPANRVSFDPASSVLAIASNDGTVKMYDINRSESTNLVGHSDAVQTVAFERNGEYLISGSSDTTIKIWS